MAERNASLVQLDFPQLTADVIAALRLTGTLGLFNMSDTVIPVISVGNVRPQTFVLQPVVFASAEILAASALDPVINTIIGDTGALAAGTYDVWAHISTAGLIAVGLSGQIALQHRDAANAATLATLLQNSKRGTAAEQFAHLNIMGYTIALNERFRFINLGGTYAGFVSTEMGFALRPTP